MRSNAILVMGMLVLFTAGCATEHVDEAPWIHARPSLVWPKPPATPRIAYVESVSGPRDLGVTKPLLQRVMESFTGVTDEHLIRPTGVAVRAGTLYVADPGAQALWIFDLSGRHYVKVHRMGKVMLISPVAVAARPDGAVFVVDSLLKKIFLVDRAGKLLQTITDDTLVRPASLAYDATTSRLYVADSNAHRIVLFAADGTRLRTLGKRGSDDGEFNFPTHLSVDKSGTLFVTDALNYRIQAFDRDGKFLWKFGHPGDTSGTLAAPKGITTDSDGNVYVVDALFDTVQIFDRKGTFLLAFGERGTGPGQFSIPGGIFISPEDRIYVADAYNQRVQVFEFVGEHY